MTNSLVPEAAQRAAKRGFIRTTAQAYATALAGGISTATILAVVTGELALTPLLITLAVTLVSPLLAGAASYASLLAAGIPEEYQEGAEQTSTIVIPEPEETSHHEATNVVPQHGTTDC